MAEKEGEQSYLMVKAHLRQSTVSNLRQAAILTAGKTIIGPSQRCRNYSRLNKKNHPGFPGWLSV
jgi:hypothetical protein